MSKSIRISVLPEVHLDIGELHNFQGELKKMSAKARNNLRRSIIEEGFTQHVYFFENSGVKYILDGHQRLDIMQSLKREGYKIPKIPSHELKAKDYKHAKKLLASFISQYGTVDKNEVPIFFDDVDFDIETEFEIPGIEPEEIFGESDQDDDIQPLDKDDQETYSKKVKTPIYEPKGVKPPIEEIANADKYYRLIDKIDQSALSEDLKTFLKHAASRHIEFRYDKIAEFYCHEKAEVQRFFEDSALVIVDFDKAIEDGYVRLTDEVAAQFKNEKNMDD